jgi:C4-dicarboxylate-specific signal transduction histidine kinase
MSNNEINIDALTRENSLLKEQVVKLTRELSKQLEDNVSAVSQNLAEQDKKAKYHAIEQSINAITSFSETVEQTIHDVFHTLCQADIIIAGGVYLFDSNRQKLTLSCYYNLPAELTERVASYDTQSPQYAIVALGVPQYDIVTSDLINQKLLKDATGSQKIAVIPLIHEQQVVGCLNLLLGKSEEVSNEDKLFLETIAWRIARIIGLHETRLKLDKTIAELNETISDLKIKQQILIQKSKMESLGELSAGMAHEINQPLVIISLSIENIMQKMVLGTRSLSAPYLQRKFESILMNVSRIQQIIDNMRIFARDQSSINFERVGVGKLIAKTLEMVSVQYRTEGIRIIAENIDEGASVFGNLFKLEQVLLNLLSNSRYAVHEKASLPGLYGYQKQIEISAVGHENQIFLEVTDNGIGITEEHIEKLFIPFFTTKREEAGTGLGLPIVYGIVKEMNGDISVESKVHEYTTIRVTLSLV